MPVQDVQYALPAGTQVGRYVIRHVLGAGGFGITYVAEDPTTGKLWAIKEFYPREFCTRADVVIDIHTDVSDSSYQYALNKFLSEAKFLQGLSHPNIVGVHEDPIETHNTAYIVMDFIEGLSFEAWLSARDAAPSEAELQPLFDKILNAVEYLHAKGFMHRDLSPENIMIQPSGEPILIDFGTLGEGLSRGASTIQFRRDEYSPPEQGAEGLEQGAYTDIFALGGALYRAVTGSPPVKATLRSGRVLQGRPDGYVPVAQNVADTSKYSPTFLEGIDRALALKAMERPQSIAIWRGMLGWAAGAEPTVLATRLAGDHGPSAAATVLAAGAAKTEGPKAGAGRKAAVIWAVSSLALLGVGVAGAAMLKPDNNNRTAVIDNNTTNTNTLLDNTAQKAADEARRAREKAERDAQRRRDQVAREAEERRQQAQRAADDRRKAEERRQAEERRKAEERRLAEARRKADENRRRQAALDNQNKNDEAARRQLIEKKRQEELKRAKELFENRKTDTNNKNKSGEKPDEFPQTANNNAPQTNPNNKATEFPNAKLQPRYTKFDRITTNKGGREAEITMRVER